MPIKEKPQLLEFNCVIEGMEDIEWNVKYDPNSESSKIALHISGNGQTFHCPVELFGDVTAFLQSKKILKPNILHRSTFGGPSNAPTQNEIPTGSSLSVPQIDGQENILPTLSGLPIDALASFDIGDSPQSIKTAETAEIVVNNVVENKDKEESEIIKRPVIRTRVNKEDPTSSAKESTLIRESMESGTKKSVKKRHQV